MRLDRARFGQTAAGVPVEVFRLEHGSGLSARLMTLGATLMELWVPDLAGRRTDIVLGFERLEPYERWADHYLGCVVGRCANRIRGAEFTLDGQRFALHANQGPNQLHGGPRGLSRAVWSAEELVRGDRPGVRFTHTSPAGEDGYPGTLAVSATYVLGARVLEVELEATADRATPVNLVQHSYFNLSGAGTILEHELELAATRYTPVDDELLPTGALEPVSGTPLDFRRPRRIGERIGRLDRPPTSGYDHNFALDAGGGGLARAARLVAPGGMALELWTSEPGLQLYSGNHLADLAGKRGLSYPRFGGLCLEAQRFPDALHQPGFPGVILRPGERYRQRTEYRFGCV
jgi:aldose 1-epimerase